MGFLSKREVLAEAQRPHLDLSGPRLESALARLATGCEEQGGIERYVAALKLKSELFRQALDDDPGSLEASTFKQLCAFMATVRRRVGPWLEEPSFQELRAALVELLAARADTSTTDARIAAFCGAFADGDKNRWVRDLAAEVLHNVDPERFPLMTRWVWDAGANTGVLREIWHAPDVDHLTIRATDDYETFLMLREEIAQFLSTNGVFRDVMQMVDMVCAQVYAEYICEQGGSYLRADFSAPEDPMQHTRRMLGLDGVRADDGRARFAAIDGEAH